MGISLNVRSFNRLFGGDYVEPDQNYDNLQQAYTLAHYSFRLVYILLSLGIPAISVRKKNKAALCLVEATCL